MCINNILYFVFCLLNIYRVLEPVMKGDYPQSMKSLVGDRLPKFTEEEKKLLKGSIDFYGINYYRSFYGKDQPNKLLISNLDNYDSLAVKDSKSNFFFHNKFLLLHIQINFY